MIARLIFNDRLSIFDMIYINIFASLGGWWLLGVIPFTVISMAIQHNMKK